jgi:sensor histidine kinase YesM
LKLYLYKIILLVCCTSYLHGQNPVSRSITNLNGLPSNSVYHLLQDKQGYIWIAHDLGLSRYDGKVFKLYKSNAKQGKSLSNLKEVGGSIWCQDFTGNFFYVQGDSLIRSSQMYTSGTYIAAQLINENTLVSTNADSTRMYNVATKKYISVARPGDFIPAQYANAKGNYFLTKNQLMLFNGNITENIQLFSTLLPKFFFLLQQNQKFYAFTRNSYPYLHLLENNKVIPLPILKSGLFIQDINIIEDEIWLSTSTGAYCYDNDWKPKYDGRCFYENSSITKILKDREGSYWFGTLNNGILFVPNINTILYQNNNEAFTALDFYDKSKSILAGTSANRLLIFDEVKNSFTELYKGPGTKEVQHIYSDKDNGDIILSSDRTRILKNKSVVRDIFLAVKSISKVNKDYYGLAVSGGFGLMPLVQGNEKNIPNWITYAKGNKDFYSINDKEVRGRWCLFNDNDSTFYVASADGLQYYNNKEKGKVYFEDKDIFPSQIIFADNQIYASTYNDGIFKIINNKATPLIGANKNIAKTIYKLAKNGDWLWAASDNLLQKINLINNKVIEYTYADGLPKAELKDIQVYNGKVFLATATGMVVFADDAESENKIVPLLALNSIQVNNKPVVLNKRLSLSSSDNNIVINFSLLGFKGEDINTVQYKINNGKWLQLDKGERNINLSAMASGDYTIVIQAFNEDGVASQKNIEVVFSIAQPFYKNGWFLLALALGIIALVYFYFRNRLRIAKRNEALLEDKIKLEQELHQSVLSSIKSQMNPHFLFNALNTIQSYIYTNEKENASLYLGKFSELTRMVLDMSNKEVVSLAEEIKALNLYLELEQLRFEDKLSYSLDCATNIDADTTYIPAMIIQPYVENAIKHGLLHSAKKWQLLINFNKLDTGIEVLVDDNGVGREKSSTINKAKAGSHKSFAVSANQKRLEILNKGLNKNISINIIDKKDNDNNALGTKVQLHIPFMIPNKT